MTSTSPIRTQSVVQIKWEFDHLKESDIIMFWFPKETVCPVTLFELGKWAMSDTDVIVGCHPEYIRKFDVECQLSLIDGNRFTVVDSLNALADAVAKRICFYCSQI
jgi:hypothetical protein